MRAPLRTLVRLVRQTCNRTMPSKKQRARAAKAAKAAAKAAEPQPQQPALDAPRTLRAQLRADERAIRRQTCGARGALKAVCVKREQIVPGCRYSVAASATASSSRVAVHVQHK